MKKDNHSKHLSLGSLAALVLSKSALNKNPDIGEHLDKCEFCNNKYLKFIGILKKVSKSDYAESLETLVGCSCPASETELEKNPSIFFALLTESIRAESASRLFGHLNSCYHCLESFAINWNDYLSIRT